MSMIQFFLKRCLFCLGLAICFLALFGPLELRAEPQTKPFRLIYVQGGDYSDFQRIFRGFALGLEQLHLLKITDHVNFNELNSVQSMWEWLCSKIKSKKIVFLRDGFYTADYDLGKMEEITEEISQRIKQRHDVDAILCFGTMAGKHISKLNTNVPIIFSSVTDAVGAKIVPSVYDSGKDNHVAVVTPGVDRRNIEIFHSIFNFTKMGIAYEDTPNGRDSVALEEIEAAAKDLGITLVRCTDTFEIVDLDLASERLASCHSKLVKDGAEAIFLTTNISITPRNAQKILQPIVNAKLPNFSQLGSSDVKLGVLMSIGEASTIEEGSYSAKLLDQIIKGKKPRSLSQFFKSYLTIAINLRTATHIGWNPPLKNLLMVDEFYE